MAYQEGMATQALFFFLSHNYEGLQNATLLLGGRLALKRVQCLVDNLSSKRELTRRAKLELVALHQLLTLQNVGPLDRIETELFSEIDPADPVVEDICLLADELLDHIKAVGADNAQATSDINLAA